MGGRDATGEVAAKLPGLDLERLASWLAADRPDLSAAPLTGRLIAGGRSNLTYAVSDGASQWILRRPPLGHVLATAHDMGREFRVMSALADTDVPVPRTYALCTDAGILGAPFYLMENVAGKPYRTASELVALGPERVQAISAGMIDALAVLHSVDPAAVGLADFGRPNGFLARQVRHLKVRRQFGRVVGGFQALKHRLADLFVEMEMAAAGSRYAAGVIATGDPDIPVGTAVAAAYCADVAVKAAEEAVQLHGGIGMTWEYPVHLYLKRAKADQLGLGSPGYHRSVLAELVDIRLGVEQRFAQS
ncbi:phosphotransferase [Nocardia stercoris]|uniref:Aminoglycoside phosphotransferase domain-containing protein n=1 Tax=Nocardia stercoris TaxID=2483361 RepID=A0A3M2KYH9_9NOCA|nr:phosphotransferase [Nocardia stercoris]RMI30512.1 hypothetical protein EBN03_20720 [Nocardia stercoris]